MQITQNQIQELKNKGLSDEKIKALALSKGLEMPKDSFLSGVVKSERGFGQSIAGALGGNAPEGSLMRKLTGQTAIDEANKRAEQVQTNLLNRIKEKRAKGEDTSRLTNALKTLDSEVNFYDILNSSTGGSLNKTGRQVFGEGLGVATDIIGAGSLPGGIGQVTKPTTGFISGLGQGAKAGLVSGSIFGGAKGVTNAMQDNKTAGEVVGAGLRGGIEGGVAGGLIGGAVGGISGSITGKAQKIARTKEDFTLDLVSPKATKDIREQAIREGRVSEGGLFKSSKIIPSTRDYNLADSIDNVVNPKASPLQNVDAINREVTRINAGVKDLITKKKVPFNTNQLLSRLNAVKEDSRLIFASDTNAENVYNAVVDEFMRNVSKKDTLGLFEARQTFDKIPAIKKLLESEGLGENVKKQIVLDVRRAANDYISSLLPVNNPYKALLKQESLMLEAVGNIAEKEISNIGKNQLQILTSKYPILKWLIGGAATGAVGAAGVGVGSAIIGSTD